MIKISKQILLVEDNESILFNTKLMLKMNGYEVLTATNGKEALSVLKTLVNPPDIIVSDIMMPEMDGYEFYSQICVNEIWHRIPFIFLTAKSSPEDVRFGKKLGVDDYVIKPFRGEDLLASIEGRLTKSARDVSMSSQYQDVLLKLEKETKLHKKEGNFYFFLVDWDEKGGPYVVYSYPEQKVDPEWDELCTKLYSQTMVIYDSKNWNPTSDAQFHINYIDMDAILVFASINDAKVRGGQRLFMLVALAKQFHYLESRRIQEKLRALSEKYKQNQKLDILSIGKELSEILQ